MFDAILLYLLMGLIGGSMFVLAVMDFVRARETQKSAPRALPFRFT